MVPVCVYEGDTIPSITLRTVYVYPKMKFKNKKQERYYWKIVRDVKKTLPIAKEVKRAVIETYEYLETLPDKKSRKRHIKLVDKGTIYSQNEEIDIFTGKTVDKVNKPRMQPIFLPVGQSFYGAI